MTKQETILVICLEETQRLVAQVLNDPTNEEWIKGLVAQFRVNNMVIDKLKRG
jgi:hypothetical protein